MHWHPCSLLQPTTRLSNNHQQYPRQIQQPIPPNWSSNSTLTVISPSSWLSDFRTPLICANTFVPDCGIEESGRCTWSGMHFQDSTSSLARTYIADIIPIWFIRRFVAWDRLVSRPRFPLKIASMQKLSSQHIGQLDFVKTFDISAPSLDPLSHPILLAN